MQISASLVKDLRERTGAGMMDCKKALVEAEGDIDQAAENMRKAGQAKADKKAGRVAAEGIVAVRVDGDARSAAMVEVNCETDFVAKEVDFGAFADAVAARALAARPADVEALGALPIEGAGSPTVEERRRELVARIGENISVRRFEIVESTGRIGTYLHQGARIGVLVDLDGGDDEVARDVAMHVAASSPLAVSEADLPAQTLDKEREIFAAQVADSGKPPEIQEKMITGKIGKYIKEVTLLGQPFVKDPDRSVAKVVAAAGATIRGFRRFEVGEGIEKRTENFADEVMAQVRGS